MQILTKGILVDEQGFFGIVLGLDKTWEVVA